jgi:hypothetical protein
LIGGQTGNSWWRRRRYVFDLMHGWFGWILIPNVLVKRIVRLLFSLIFSFNGLLPWRLDPILLAVILPVHDSLIKGLVPVILILGDIVLPVGAVLPLDIAPIPAVPPVGPVPGLRVIPFGRSIPIPIRRSRRPPLPPTVMGITRRIRVGSRPWGTRSRAGVRVGPTAAAATTAAASVAAVAARRTAVAVAVALSRPPVFGPLGRVVWSGDWTLPLYIVLRRFVAGGVAVGPGLNKRFIPDVPVIPVLPNIPEILVVPDGLPDVLLPVVVFLSVFVPPVWRRLVPFIGAIPVVVIVGLLVVIVILCALITYGHWTLYYKISQFFEFPAFGKDHIIQG